MHEPSRCFLHHGAWDRTKPAGRRRKRKRPRKSKARYAGRVSQLMLLAGGIVEPGAGHPGRVSAFVAYNPKPGQSRMFKVSGSAAGPSVGELPARTTVDISYFTSVMHEELDPVVDEITSRGGHAALATPRAEWVCDVVRQHLVSAEGVNVP